jgi:peroxiredoxin
MNRRAVASSRLLKTIGRSPIQNGLKLEPITPAFQGVVLRLPYHTAFIPKALWRIALSFFFLVFLFSSCTPKPQNFQLQVSLHNAQPGTFYLYRLADNQAPTLVDSFHNTQLDAQFTLHDAAPWSEALYQLSIPSLRSNLYFIADVPDIQTKINAVDVRAYTTEGSKGSLALQHLQHVQNPLQDSMTILNNKINNQIGDASSLLAASTVLQQQLMDNYFQFADTTTSPLAALFITQQLDFGDDRAGHKAFISRLEKRFKQHPQLASFIQKTKDYLALFEVEYEIGDSLPSASFVDRNGLTQSPAQWKGGYYLLEFWSSFCAPCLAQLEQKRALYQKYRYTGFKMLAFSLDEDPDMLNNTLQNAQFPWPVVADLKGWSSAAVNAYKIDSIPFNFLVGPDGKVAMKNVDAIQLDSVLKDWKKR